MRRKKDSAFQDFSDEEIEAKLKETPLERNDLLALIIAAFKTFVPALVLMLGAFYLIIWFIFIR